MSDIDPNRLRFIQATAAGAPSAFANSPTSAEQPAGDVIRQAVTLRVNGERFQLSLDARATLLDTLREELQLFGTKKGCDHGQCGACTVHVNGRRINSCLTFAVMHQEDEITTIEGLEQDGRLHPVQE